MVISLRPWQNRGVPGFSHHIAPDSEACTLFARKECVFRYRVPYMSAYRYAGVPVLPG